jgi:signal transduction histidine kinase
VTPHRLEPPRPRIRFRFTALYAATLFVVLLLSAGLTRFLLRATLDREFDDAVRASAALVSQFFRTEIAEYRTIEATLTHIAGELVFEDRAIHIRRPDDSHFGDSIPMAHRAALGAGDPARAVRFPLEPRLAPGWDVEVHASTASLHALQERIDRAFLVGIPLLVLLAGAAGWWLTGRTLRPVGAMADAAARIGPGHGGRLPIENPTDELGRLGVRFNALLDRLDGALLQQRHFLADAAHELRTPIARMRARVELALLPSSPPSARGELLGALDAELKAMSHQVDELLELARADAMAEGARDADRQGWRPIFLDDLVADELARWQPQAAQGGRRLQVAALEEAPLAGDPVLLARLVGVLVDNALRYGAPGGTVELRVELRVEGTGDRVVLQVDDDGPGILPEERERIFDRFYRGTAVRHRGPGSGLGLSIAAWIVARHDGTIAATDSPLGGTRFSISFPKAAPGESSATVPVAAASRP